jgi:hypothetical protein
MATRLKTFRKVLGSGSAEPLSVTLIPTRGFAIRAEKNNVADIYVGDSTVTSSTGMFLHADESNEKYAGNLAGGYSRTYELSKIYLIGTSGDAVRVEFEYEE